MPDARDFNTRRPPRRKSWEENADENNDNVDHNSDSRDDKPWRNQKELPERPPPKPGRAQGYDPQLSKQNRSGNDSDEDPEADPRAKNKKKRLFKLLGNEALCLIIIFGLIGAFNWMATDYSGDYMGQSNQLRMVRLTIMRRAATIDAELSYSQLGVLELDQSKDQPAAQGDNALNLDFVTPERWHRPGSKSWHAKFKGHIKDGTAAGTITDITGTYKVTLSKNVLTSLFTQMQAHIPRLPTVPLPSLFDDKGKNLQVPPPGGLRTK